MPFGLGCWHHTCPPRRFPPRGFLVHGISLGGRRSQLGVDKDSGSPLGRRGEGLVDSGIWTRVWCGFLRMRRPMCCHVAVNTCWLFHAPWWKGFMPVAPLTTELAQIRLMPGKVDTKPWLATEFGLRSSSAECGGSVGDEMDDDGILRWLGPGNVEATNCGSNYPAKLLPHAKNTDRLQQWN